MVRESRPGASIRTASDAECRCRGGSRLHRGGSASERPTQPPAAGAAGRPRCYPAHATAPSQYESAGRMLVGLPPLNARILWRAPGTPGGAKERGAADSGVISKAVHRLTTPSGEKTHNECREGHPVHARGAAMRTTLYAAFRHEFIAVSGESHPDCLPTRQPGTSSPASPPSCTSTAFPWTTPSAPASGVGTGQRATAAAGYACRSSLVRLAPRVPATSLHTTSTLL